MNHLEFAEKLNELGVSVRGTKRENEVQKIEILNYFGEPDFVEIKNFELNYIKKNGFSKPNPLQAIIREAIDIDTWKHSWHTDIVPENYEKFIEIIQDKVLKRAKEIDMLIAVYFQLNKEITKDL